MGLYVEMVLSGARRTRVLTEKLLVGVKPEFAARFPRFETSSGPVVINTNHATFVMGHLGLYPTRVLGMMGLDGSNIAAPAAWNDLFKAGAVCTDDIKGDIYPSLETLAAHYFKATDFALEALAGVDDSALLKVHPDEAMRQRFPQVGQAVTFLLNNHVMMHMGQFSAWRRCYGLPSAM